MAERRKATVRKKSARKSASKAVKKVAKKTAKKTAKKVKKKTPPKTAAKRKTGTGSGTKRWSQDVTEHSDALDLKQGVFTLTDPKKIAASLKRSAEHSARRKTGAYRSALSMLTFYINRAGKTLSKTQAARLERAKDELKKQFGREE